MRYYSYNTFDDNGNPIVDTKSEKEILKEYFPYWSDRMADAGLQDKVTMEDCLDDWVDVHWAWEVNE